MPLDEREAYQVGVQRNIGPIYSRHWMSVQSLDELGHDQLLLSATTGFSFGMLVFRQNRAIYISFPEERDPTGARLFLLLAPVGSIIPHSSCFLILSSRWVSETAFHFRFGLRREVLGKVVSSPGRSNASLVAQRNASGFLISHNYGSRGIPRFCGTEVSETLWQKGFSVTCDYHCHLGKYCVSKW